MATWTTRIDRAGRITLPPELVRALGLQPGEIFAIPAAELSDRAFVLRPYRLLDHAAGEIALTALADMRPDGQVLLPAPIRHLLQLRQGDSVQLTEHIRGVRISVRPS